MFLSKTSHMLPWSSYPQFFRSCGTNPVIVIVVKIVVVHVAVVVHIPHIVAVVRRGQPVQPCPIRVLSQPFVYFAISSNFIASLKNFFSVINCFYHFIHYIFPYFSTVHDRAGGSPTPPALLYFPFLFFSI